MAYENPFYPGYYPGDPFVRPPRGGRYIPPDFNFDAFARELDELSGSFNVPEQIKDELVSDIKFNLSARSFPSRLNREALEDFPTEETGELPGVTSLSVDLNPVKWVKDPGDQVKKTVKGWWKSLADWDDLETKMERDHLWSPMLGLSTFPDRYISSAHEKIGTETERIFKSRAKGELSLADRGVIGTEKKKVKQIVNGEFRQVEIDKEYDVYERAGNEYLLFISNKKSAFARPGSWDSFRNSAINGISTELQQIRDQDSRAARAGAGTGRILDASQTAVANRFIAKERVAESMAGLGEAISETRKVMVKEMYGVSTKANVQSMVVGTTGDNDINRCVEQSRQRISHLKGLYSGDELAEISRQLAPYENYLGRLEKKITAVNTGGIRSTKALYREFGALGDELTRGDKPFIKGIQATYLNRLSNELYFENSEIMGVINDTASSTGRLTGAQRTARLMRLGKSRFEWEEAKDFVDALENGRLFNSYIWPRVRAMLEGYTPAYYVGEFMKRTHYFGLVIDSKYIGKEIGPFGALIKHNRMFHNYFTVNGIKVRGGSHFQVALDLHKSLRDGSITMDDSFFRLLNGNLQAGDNISAFLSKSIDEATVAQFKDFLVKYREKLGLAVDSHGNILNTPENAEKLKALFSALHNKNNRVGTLPITAAFAGLLDKLTAKLNYLQDKVFAPLAKLTSPITYVKNAAAEAFADAAAGLAAALGIATAGAGDLVAPLIRTVVRWVSVKVMNVFENITKAFVTGDFSKFITGALDGFFNTMVKFAMYTGIVVLLFGVGITFIMTTIIGGISPVDYTRTTLYAGDGIGPGLPDDIVDAGDCNWDEVQTTGISGGSPLVARAAEIADPLERGFWCLWNKQIVEFPQFWNEAEFQANPFPPPTFSCYGCLFWCTRLIIYSYRTVYGTFPDAVRSDIMKDYFDTQHQYWPRENIQAVSLQPGDVVFFQTPRLNRINHVAMVYSAAADSVGTVHSNAYFKTLPLMVDPATGLVQDVGTMRVIGFGRW